MIIGFLVIDGTIGRSLCQRRAEGIGPCAGTEHAVLHQGIGDRKDFSLPGFVKSRLTVDGGQRFERYFFGLVQDQSPLR